MKPRILALLQLQFILLVGCNPATQNPETGKPNVGTTNTLADAAPPKMEFFDMEKLEVARANTLSDDEKTNRLHTITKDAAAEIAKKAAFRRGRNAIRVSSVSFEQTYWIVMLKFEPEDQVGNWAMVRVATNGAITLYYRGL